jgi:pheromone shutdown protein TraB
METKAQKALRVVTNINWFIFGAVFGSVGMFLITGGTGWAVVGFVSAFLFGMGTAAVSGAKSIVSREEVKER